MQSQYRTTITRVVHVLYSSHISRLMATKSSSKDDSQRKSCDKEIRTSINNAGEILENRSNLPRRMKANASTRGTKTGDHLLRQLGTCQSQQQLINEQSHLTSQYSNLGPCRQDAGTAFRTLELVRAPRRLWRTGQCTQ